MKKYVCSVCGYVYDEAKGIPEAGIPAGTRWEELPESWVCPLCGASKSEVVPEGGEAPVKTAASLVESIEDIKELTPLEMSALCTNLAKGCEKQYRAEEAAAFTELGAYFKSASAPAEGASYAELLRLVESDLASGFPNANAAAGDPKDRGALRALVWSEKVTRILNSLLARYEREGEAMLENTGVYVCTICGFVFIGDTPPELCPVCKVPSWKFEIIEGRAV